MPITEYFQESNQIFYRMDDLDHPGKTIDMSAVNVLESDPLMVEIFNYKTRHMNGRPKAVVDVIPTFMEEQMVVDRLEVGQYAAALELIEGMLAAGKKLPYSLWLGLFNFLLKPVHSKTKEKHMNHWSICQDAYKILLNVLQIHGADSLAPIFNEFSSMNLIPSREYKMLLNERYDMLDIKMLSNYSDFWGFVRSVLSMKKHTLEAICHRWVLDILVQIMQVDLLTKLGDEEDVKHSLLVNTLKKGSFTRSRGFDTYLEIILLDLSNTHEDSHDFPKKLINMFFTIACFEQVFTMEHVVSHSATFFEKMNAADGLRFLDLIEYPSFTIALGDTLFDKCDQSRVPTEYKHFRNTQHSPLDLHKLLFYIFSVFPAKPYTLDSILSHVQLVLKYCNSVFVASTIQHIDSNMKSSAFSTDTLSLLNQHKADVSSKWEAVINPLAAASTDKNDSLQAKIGFCIYLTRTSLCSYTT